MSDKKNDAGKKERSGGGMVREQHAPFYKVVTGGITVEYTDKLNEATSVFKDAYAKPKYIYQIGSAGEVACVSAAF